MLKKGVIFVTIYLLFGVYTVSANTLIERKINGYSAKIIEHSTDSKLYDIKVGIHPKDGGTLRSIMGTVGGITGVNGVFECPKDYAACGGKNYTINERYVNGEKKATYKSTGDRVVFAWDKNIKPFLFQTDKINQNIESRIFEGFANHPLLLKEGISQTHIYHEKGLIDYKMKSRGTRNFICSNSEGDKIFFGLIYNITIDNLALILKDFGCWNALNLDAGASTTFIYNGKYIVNPQRDILDGVFIVPKNIDTKKIDSQAKSIMKNLLLKMKDYKNSEKISALKKLNKTLNSSSQNIYKKNTKKIYDDVKIYKSSLVLEDVQSNSNARKLVLTEAFKQSPQLYFKDNNIYKKELEKIEKKEVGTRLEISSKQTIAQIYLVNLLRQYTSSLTSIYQRIEEINYIKKLDLPLNINVEL